MLWIAVCLSVCLTVTNASQDKPCFALKNEIEGSEYDYEPLCTDVGTFRSRQCDPQRRCWCADEQGTRVTAKAKGSQISEADCDMLTGRLEKSKTTHAPRRTTSPIDVEGCREGYWGPYCEEPCECGDRSLECDRYEGCICEEGFVGRHCSDIINLCTRPNACQLPHEDCVPTPGSYRCVCEKGFDRNSEGLCDANNDRKTTLGPDQKGCPLGFWGEGCDRICSCGEHSVRCDDVEGCICTPGWQGSHCRDNVDECLILEPCNSPRESCVDTPGSYRCVCASGYHEIEDGMCVKDGVTTRRRCENDCEHYCEREGPYEFCMCRPGYRLVEGTRCIRVKPTDHPTRRDCEKDCEHYCEREGPYEFCMCRPGYRLVEGTRCIRIIDSTTPARKGGCEMKCEHFCGYRYGSSTQRMCRCWPGYELIDGYKCQRIRSTPNAYIDVKADNWYSQNKVMLIVMFCLLLVASATSLVIFSICLRSSSSKAKLKAKGKLYAANMGEPTFNLTKSSDKVKLIVP